MGSFGENLRREREMRGVTLEEISAATRISVRFLQAIESEEFPKLPGGIFSRSFVRSYARYLGLDEEHILSEYQLVAEPREDFSLKRLGLTRPARDGKSSRSPVLTFVVAGVFLAGGYAVYHYSRRVNESVIQNAARVAAAPAPNQPQTGSAPATPAAPPAAAATPAPVPTSGVEPSTQGSSEAGTAPPSPSTPEPDAAKPAEPKEGLVLQVAATERVWVGVQADGRTALQRILNPHEVETVKARQFFDVTIGNAEGIILTLNGETLKPLGRRGEVKSVHLTYDDLKNLTP